MSMDYGAPVTAQNGHDGKRGSYTGIWEPNMQPQLARDLMTPGKVIQETLMRGDFEDKNDAITIGLAIAKLQRHGLDDELPALLYRVAAQTAVTGKRAGMYLQGITGVVLPSFFGGKGQAVRRTFTPQTEERKDDKK